MNLFTSIKENILTGLEKC